MRIISNHTKIDTLFNSGSQANLISKELVKQLKLETIPHPKPYPLRWICKDANLQVSKKCILRFAITAHYVDWVELDVVPLDITGVGLGSPYLFDRKTIFHRHENKYHLFKDGKEYIARAHKKKLESSLLHAGQLKRLVNASQNLTLLMVKQQDFVQFPFHIIANINDDMFQFDNSLPLKEDDRRLHKIPLVLIGAENEVLVQDSMRRKSMQAKRAHNSAWVNVGFRMADWYGEKTWSGFDTRTGLIQQKFAT